MRSIPSLAKHLPIVVALALTPLAAANGTEKPVGKTSEKVA